MDINNPMDVQCDEAMYLADQEERMKMSNWPGKITKLQAIKLIEQATAQDDPFWEYLTEDFYDKDTDTMPTIYHIFDAMGITEDEYKEATGAHNVAWPKPI